MKHAGLVAVLFMLGACSERGAPPAEQPVSESASVALAVADVEAARAEAATPPPAP